MATTLADLRAALPGGRLKLLTGADSTGSHRGRWNATTRTETLRFKVKWDDHETFLALVFGGQTSYGGTASAKVSRQLPMVYPYNPRLYAIEAEWEGSNASDVPSERVSTDARPYASRVYTITFSTLPFLPEVSDQPYLGVKQRSGFEVVTIPGWGLAFSNGEKIDQDYGRIVTTKAIEVTRYQLPSLDLFNAVSDPLYSYVNSVPLAIRGTTYAAGTLLYNGADTDEQKTVNGSVQYQITMQFLFKAVPWNSAIRSDGVIDSITPAVYPTADLSPLISFGN